jgi:replicative DNA helicase
MQNLDAEAAVLSVCINNPVCCAKTGLTAEDFNNPINRAVWQCLTEMLDANLVVDLITLAERVEAAGVNITTADLIRIQTSVGSERAIKHYARQVSDARKVRDMYLLSAEISEIAEGAQNVETKQDLIEQLFVKREQKSPATPEQMNAAIKEFLDVMDYRSNNPGITGLPTGIKSLDDRTSGLQPSDLILLAARPAMGKTALAMNIATNTAVSLQKPVLFFSLEMAKAQLIERQTSNLANVNLKHIRDGKLDDSEWMRINGAVRSMKDKPLFVDDTAGLTLQQIRGRARAIHRRTPLSLIVIDYLQLIRFSGRSKNEEVGEISRSLKELAKELSLPVLCLSQLNRGCEERSNKRPRNSDLRDSGSLEQDADQIFFIYRDEIHNENSDDKGIAELICTKFRNGEIGTDYLSTKLYYQRFEQLPADYQRQEKTVFKYAS